MHWSNQLHTSKANQKCLSLSLSKSVLVYKTSNEVALGDVNIFSQLTIFYGKSSYTIIKSVFYWSELVEIDTLLARFKNNMCLAVILDCFENADSHNFQSYQLIMRIWNSKYQKTFPFPVLKSKAKSDQNCDHESVMVTITSSNLNCLNWRKTMSHISGR